MGTSPPLLRSEERTLECVECKYSRKKVETFYDFSLDLPSRSTSSIPSSQPQRCHCGTVAAVINQSPKEGEHKQIACCAANTCSFQADVVQNETNEFQTDADVDNGTHSEGRGDSSVASVSSSSIMSIESLLKKQFESEKLELTCEQCENGKEAEAACEVKTLPAVLVLHLKRFEMDMSSGNLYKRSDPVEAASEILPRKFINSSHSSSENEEPYVLKCVIHHIGKSINEGHYMADVCGTDGTWRRYNDTQETQVC
jgi:hypothetical protein